MAERCLRDRILGYLEEWGPYSAILKLTEEVEADRRRLAELERLVLAGGTVPDLDREEQP
jgi:hypothetical protein